MPNYEIRAGLNYPSPNVTEGERRAEPGEIVDDLPAGSLAWLLKDGLVVETDADVTPLPKSRRRQTAPLPEPEPEPEAPAAEAPAESEAESEG